MTGVHVSRRKIRSVKEKQGVDMKSTQAILKIKLQCVKVKSILDD